MHSTHVFYDLAGATRELLAVHPGKSAATTLERGELSLLTRAWLADHAARTTAGGRPSATCPGASAP